MKYFLIILTILFAIRANAQNGIEYFVVQSKMNSPLLVENSNTEKIIQLQSKLIDIQNKSAKVNFTSELYLSPYFNNNGNFISVTNMPTSSAVGYDVNVSNGALYSAQLSVSKNLLNARIVENLHFQNSLQSNSNELNREFINHNLEKIVADNYVLAFQIQSQKEFLDKEIIEINKRIKLVELLAQKGVLQESDYLLVQLDLKSKTTELQQVESTLLSAINQLYSLCNLEYTDSTILLLEPNLSMSKQSDSLFMDKKYTNDSLQIEANTLVFTNQYRPQLNVYANTGLNSTNISNFYRHFGVSGGVRLTIPIYDGGQKNNFIQQQLISQENLIAFQESNEIQLNNSLKNLQDQISNIQKNIAALEEQLITQSKILDVYKIKLANGQVSIIDFLNVSRDYRQTQFLKIQSQTNLWLVYNQFNFTNW